MPVGILRNGSRIEFEFEEPLRGAPMSDEMQAFNLQTWQDDGREIFRVLPARKADGTLAVVIEE